MTHNESNDHVKKDDQSDKENDITSDVNKSAFDASFSSPIKSAKDMEFRSPNWYKAVDTQVKKKEYNKFYAENSAKTKTPKVKKAFSNSFVFKNENEVKRFSEIHKDDSYEDF